MNLFYAATSLTAFRDLGVRGWIFVESVTEIGQEREGLAGIPVPKKYENRMFLKIAFVVFLLPVLFAELEITQRIKVIPKTYDLEGEVRVFTDKGDIQPPYQVSAEVKHCGIRAYTYVYINGQQVLPHSSRIIRGNTLTPSFKNAKTLENLVSSGAGTYEAGAQAMVKNFEQKLENNYSLLFSSAKPLYVQPGNYELLRNEIRLARNMSPGEWEAHDWKVLDLDTIRAFNRASRQPDK